MSANASRNGFRNQPHQHVQLTDMEADDSPMDHPKRRRRRRKVFRSPVEASLHIDPAIKGDVGLLSKDLFDNLFGWSYTFDQERGTHFVAVSSRSSIPYDFDTDGSWTIFAVKCQEALKAFEVQPANGTLRLPASSPAVQCLSKDSNRQGYTKKFLELIKPLQVYLLDVEPIRFSRVFVTVDGDALRRHEEIQKKFGGGFGIPVRNGSAMKGKGKTKATSRTEFIQLSDEVDQHQRRDELTAAIRSALELSQIIHEGDLLPLPLPAHPITHVTFPPARITLCEPVRQGLVSSGSKIVVNQTFNVGKEGKRSADNNGYKPEAYSTKQNGEDTDEGSFFAATESNAIRKSSQTDYGESSLDSCSASSSENESDSSLNNVISMSSPILPAPSSDGQSSVATATPRAGNRRPSGLASPGSTMSRFTGTTSRQGSSKGKVFQVCSLTARIPTHVLYPRPNTEEDDEIRVYIDLKFFPELRCFSGDWVRVQSIISTGGSERRWVIDEVSDESRLVKLYGLPDTSRRTMSWSTKKMAPILSHRSSISNPLSSNHPTPQIWLSPILYANLGSPKQIKLSSLKANSSIRQSSYPEIDGRTVEHVLPIAAEITLAKISTPIAQENILQEAIYSALKEYFESRRRILKTGDLIALAFDVNVGRLLGSSTTENTKDTGDLLTLVQNSVKASSESSGVVWFIAGQVSRTPSERYPDEGDIWCGAARVDPTITRMPMGASRQCRIPSAMDNSWMYYLGLTPQLPARKATNVLSSPLAPPLKQYISPLRRHLRELFAASSSPRAVNLGIEPSLVLLYSNQRNIGKASIASLAASDLGLHTYTIDAYDIISEGNAGDIQESSMNARIARAMSCGPHYTSLLIRHVDILTSSGILSALQEAAKKVRVLVATTTQMDQVPKDLRNLFTHEIEMSAPDEGEREGILQSIIQDRGVRISHDVDLAAIAIKTAALVAGNLADIVGRALIARQERLEAVINVDRDGILLMRDLAVSGGDWACCVTKADFDIAVEAARRNFADAIGAPKIPNVSWDDVGGLESVKDALMDTIQLPMERPELFAKGMKKRSGILFYGPPGTGKTLLAKAIATEFSLNFFSIKGPELLNMYIGESEANVRRVFQRARDARPCVVFFDELDSVAPKRGNQGDSGGVMDRIVSQLLAELDGMSDGEEGGGGVFVIGATNRPDLLDQALLRPGRFDKMLYLGVSDTHQKQLTILEALTRRFTLDPELSLEKVAESLPFTYTGADLYALCSDAMLKAITRQASAVDAKIKALPSGLVSTAYFFDHLATKDDVAVMVTEMDFEAAKHELVGSVR